MSSIAGAGRASLVGQTLTTLAPHARRLAAALAGRGRRALRAVVGLAGLALIDAGLWQWHTIAGLIGAGVALLLVEWRTETPAPPPAGGR